MSDEALSDEAIVELRRRFGRHFYCSKHGHRQEAEEVTFGAVRDDGEQLIFGSCGYTVFERPADVPMLALLAELGRLRAENAALSNRLCDVTTVFPCGGDCGCSYRPRDMETLAGRVLCAHCLRREAERLMGTVL